jgi:hypothetical protein
MWGGHTFSKGKYAQNGAHASNNTSPRAISRKITKNGKQSLYLHYRNIYTESGNFTIHFIKRILMGGWRATRKRPWRDELTSFVQRKTTCGIFCISFN